MQSCVERALWPGGLSAWALRAGPYKVYAELDYRFYVLDVAGQRTVVAMQWLNPSVAELAEGEAVLETLRLQKLDSP